MTTHSTVAVNETLSPSAQILNRVSDAGNLAGAARIIVQHIYRLFPNAAFQPIIGSASEWVLRPRNWVSLRFSQGRSGIDYKITVSVDRWRENMPTGTSLEIHAGRYPQWSKFTITSVAQLPDALAIIHMACPYTERQRYLASIADTSASATLNAVSN